MAKIYTDSDGNSFIRAFRNQKGAYYFSFGGYVFRVYENRNYIDVTVYTENKEQEENEMDSNIK